MNESPLTKICSKCKIEKPLGEFNNHKGRKDGKNNICKTCSREDNLRYSKLNREVLRQYQVNYRDINKGVLVEKRKELYPLKKELFSERQKAYYSENKEVYAKKDRGYRQTSLGKASVSNSRHKRRTITKQGDVTQVQMLQLLSDGKECFYCQCDLSIVKAHIDHFTPLSKGGRHTISNLVVSCATCNLRKGAKDPFQFMLDTDTRLRV